MDAEAGMAAHSQRWGTANKAWPIAQPRCIVGVVIVLYPALDRAGVWCVIEDLVLFIYSVHRGRKFH